jgi:hypothetical protein
MVAGSKRFIGPAEGKAWERASLPEIPDVHPQRGEKEYIIIPRFYK